MFRRITNGFAGRKRVADEPMDFSAIQRLLSELNEGTRINMTFRFCRKYGTRRDATPVDIAGFVKRQFHPYPSSSEYFEANHQVFSGEQGERHYVDLRAGRIGTSAGTQEFRRSPYIKATLDYVLKIQE